MGWSLLLDVLLVIGFIVALLNGYRAGLLHTAAGLVGLILGGIAAYFVMPWVASLVPSPEWRAPTAIVAALLLLSLGAWLGAIVGGALRHGARAAKLGLLDRVLGAIGNLIVTAFVVALVGSGVSAMGVPVVSPAVAGSRVLSTLDQLTPAPMRTLLAELRTAALGEGIPWLVEVLDGPTEAPQLPSGGIDDAELARAAASVVRITGTAFQCGSNLSGSGFVGGYPFGGPLELRPARVMSVGPITIEEAGRTSTRDIMTLAADVDHGNSGGPVLTGDGAVGGVVFAKSESVANVGYAIPVTTLGPLAATAPSLDAPVDSGSCVSAGG